MKEPEGGVRQSAAKEKTEETKTAEAKTIKEQIAKERQRTIYTAAQETKAGLKTAVERAI